MLKSSGMDKTLNSEQLQAIKHNKGPLLIIAGAGTGKTTVVTERIKYLITKGYAKPEEILALTFTEKAALEMEERVDKAMPLSYGDVWITTFHSFCDQILRESGLHIGLPTNFKLMTKEKSIDLFKRNLFKFSLKYFRPLGNPHKFIDSILTHISRLQDEVVDPEDYLNWVKDIKKKNKDKTPENLQEINKWEELAAVYKEYDQLKLDQGKFDFGDLVIKTIRLFNKRANILYKYQQKFKYILVDEYQDTNYGQNELVNLLAQKHKNITVVGDDNQSIYRFRGASISNILKFKKTYPDAKTITLNKNYRSTQNILDSAYKLITNNNPDTLEVKLGIDKKLVSNKGAGSSVSLSSNESEDGEVSFVAKTIQELVEKESYQFKDFAILVRANAHSSSFIRELERRGIPHQFLGPSSLLLKEEIVDLLSYLKSLYDPENNESFYRLISSKFLGLEPGKLLTVASFAKKKSLSIYEVFAENFKENSLVQIFNKHISEINTKSAGEILYEYLVTMGIYEEILKNEDTIKAKNISEFFKKIKTFENENPTAGLREVVDYLELLVEVGESPTVQNDLWQENNAVNILTVHSSKGLEFPVVFMVNLVSDRFPSRNRSDDLPIPDQLIKEDLPGGDFHIQEERRLFYVGMTRAKDKLYLSWSKIYTDGKREKKISPFVLESLGEDVELNLVKNTPRIHPEKKLENKVAGEDKNKNITKIDFLSVSQIETFEACPLHYKLKYIYKLPSALNASTSFGISIHGAIKNIYQVLETGEKLNDDLIVNTLKSNWIEEGFLEKEHKKLFFDKGLNYLKGYFENKLNIKIKPLFLEEKFVVKLNDNLKIGGTIDRIDELDGGKIEIIDYKTAEKVPDQKEVDKNLQLSFYAIAASSLYNKKPEDIILSLYYFEGQQKITTMRTSEDLEVVKEKIFDIRKEMENSDFKCAGSFICQNFCEYPSFCNLK